MNDKSKQIPSSASDNVAAFLQKVAATTSPMSKTSPTVNRLLFALDATASRAHVWDQSMHIQNEMFAETSKLGGLAIQLAYYQGYHEFYTTPWHHQSQALLDEMRHVQCVSGMTQLRRVLQHAIHETKLNKLKAMVFVGDCFEEDAQQVQQLAGQLSILGVPVFVFQEGYDPQAEHIFKYIANITRGAYSRFDASSAQQLKDLLRAVAIFAAGGQRALNADSTLGSSPLISQLRAQLPKL